MSLNMDGWIPVADWCEKYKERKNTVLKRASDGFWKRGEHISAPDGSDTFVHEERCKAWLEERARARAA